MKCELCPRRCGADRSIEKGICGVSDKLMAARAALHYWEEPCISGKEGSGAVFFSGCSLGCVYCQNQEISRGKTGKEITPERLLEIFLELQEQGANNINLVTAAHYAPWVAWALYRAKDRGLHIPIVYNSGGYESVDTLRLLEGLVDIYLPDMKYTDPEMARLLSGAQDYPQIAAEAIAEMVRQTGPMVFDDRGLLQRGTLVRHLVLPGRTRASVEVLRFLHDTFKEDIGISIMSQYTPVSAKSSGLKDQCTPVSAQVSAFKDLNRKVTKREYQKVLNAALEMGIEKGYIQEGDTAEESFIPPFDCEGV